MAPYTWNEDGIWGVLNDDLRVRVGRSQGSDRLWIGVDARWRDDRDDQANYTHDDHNTYAADEISIDAEGLLTALHRHDSARVVDFRQGFTLRLPPSFIAPLRKAIKAASEG
jgi:hypothetical protein